MIPDLIPAHELDRIEANTDRLLSTARCSLALDPSDESLVRIVLTLDMIQEILDAHEVIGDRILSMGAEAVAAHHATLARYARQIRAERLLMLEYLL